MFYAYFIQVQSIYSNISLTIAYGSYIIFYLRNKLTIKIK